MEGWGMLSPWCSLYRRAQGTKRQDTLFTIAEVTTGVLSYCSSCTIVTSAHCRHAFLPSSSCLVVLDQPEYSRYEPGASQYRVTLQAEDTSGVWRCRLSRTRWFVQPRYPYLGTTELRCASDNIPRSNRSILLVPVEVPDTVAPR